jgi:hypothetical protein
MATTFAADWAAAKAAFLKATDKKKPSSTFLGVFNKGTGIGSALKEADAAKTAGEFVKAMKAFKSAFDDYVKTLDKAIADPKITDPDAKPAYSAAATKLKAELLNIYTSAGKVSQALVGEQKKTAVDPTALKATAEAERFAALKTPIAELRRVRRACAESLQQLLTQGNEFLDQMGNLIAAARPKGESGGSVDAFLRDPAIKKLHDAAKERIDAMPALYDKYVEACKTATRLQAGVGKDYKAEFDDLVAIEVERPSAFAVKLAAEMKKKPGKKASDMAASDSEEIKARLNPRHLRAKLADMTKQYDLLFNHCTAAAKAKQSGGADRANDAVAEAQKALARLQAVFAPISDDYSKSNKNALKETKDGKDIIEQVAKMDALQSRAAQTVALTKKSIG